VSAAGGDRSIIFTYDVQFQVCALTASVRVFLSLSLRIIDVCV
jgi:hypothetical protein